MKPRKERPKEYGASGLYFQKSFTVSPDRDKIQLRKWEFWESLRRNEKYIKLCEGIKFLPTGTISPRWANPLKNRRLIAERQGRVFELFGVESIMDPERPYNELPLGAVETLGVTPDAVTLIAPHIRPGQLFPDADSYKKRFIDEGRFITLRIDITQLDGEIRQKAEHFISEHRKLAGIAPPDTRTRFKELMEAFQVYDLREAKKNDTEIIKNLWPAKFKAAKSSDEAARQRKYVVLSRKYKADGLEDREAEDRAYREAYRGVRFLYQRVADRYLSAKNRIEGMTQK